MKDLHEEIDNHFANFGAHMANHYAQKRVEAAANAIAEHQERLREQFAASSVEAGGAAEAWAGQRAALEAEVAAGRTELEDLRGRLAALGAAKVRPRP